MYGWYIEKCANRIEIAKGQDLYDDEYDFDKMNLQIEKMLMEGNNNLSDSKKE